MLPTLEKLTLQLIDFSEVDIPQSFSFLIQCLLPQLLCVVNDL